MIKRGADFYFINAFIKIFSIVVIYLLFSLLIIGFKTDQLILSATFITGYFSNITGTKFILAFSIFIVYWILFDYMKAFLNYVYNKVHILELYNTEKMLFGISKNGIKATPNEFWISRATTFLDILSGLFYLCWIPVSLAFATYLFFKDKVTGEYRTARLKFTLDCKYLLGTAWREGNLLFIDVADKKLRSN